MHPFEDAVQFDGGVKIPASAGAGKLFTSDGSGNGTWATLDLSGRMAVPGASQSGNAAWGASRTISATRPALVIATVYITAFAVSVQAVVDSSQVAIIYMTNGYAGTWSMTFIVPANKAYSVQLNYGTAALDTTSGIREWIL